MLAVEDRLLLLIICAWQAHVCIFDLARRWFALSCREKGKRLIRMLPILFFPPLRFPVRCGAVFVMYAMRLCGIVVLSSERKSEGDGDVFHSLTTTTSGTLMELWLLFSLLAFSRTFISPACSFTLPSTCNTFT